jgi:hypothetical protein
MNRLSGWRALALVGALAGGAFAQAQDAAAPQSTFFEDAKITVNEGADADGFLRVRVRPEGGEAREATVDVSRHMGENEIAKAIARALEPALAPDYEIDKDAGEHIKIRKADRAAPNFAVEITFNSPGFSITLDK